MRKRAIEGGLTEACLVAMLFDAKEQISDADYLNKMNMLQQMHKDAGHNRTQTERLSNSFMLLMKMKNVLRSGSFPPRTSIPKAKRALRACEVAMRNSRVIGLNLRRNLRERRVLLESSLGIAKSAAAASGSL